MNLRNGYSQYREQSVMTAGPGELILMLYDGCLRQLRLARLALESGENSRPDYETAGQALNKAQDIVMELINGLDLSFSLARELFSLYEFVDRQLVQTNIKKDSRLLIDVEEIMADLRDTWEQAVRISRTSLAAGE